MPMQWEVVNRELVEKVMKTYGQNMTGISSIIQVMSQPHRGNVREPGNHGSIVVAGDMHQPHISWANAFKYDCTLTNGTSRSSI